MNPKHIRCVPKNNIAYAPYNFIELADTTVTVPRESLPKYDSYSSSHNTGEIRCTLTTESPLYIRCGLQASDFIQEKSNSLNDLDNCSPEERARRTNFFTNPATQKPVLPGSSIRGMLRMLVEVAGYGKLDKVADSQLIYRAVGDTSSLGNSYRERLILTEDNRYTPLVKAGYMKQFGSTWKILPAKPIIGDNESFARIEKNDFDTSSLTTWHGSKNSYQIKVIVQQPDFHDHQWYAKAQSSEQENACSAVLVKTGSAPKKCREFVFGMPHEQHDGIPIPDNLKQDYERQITDDQKKLLGNDCALQNMQPVFYLLDEDGKVVFFGHAMMFRLPYETSLREFLPDYLKSETSDPQYVDLAESLFGHVRDRKSDDSQVSKGRLSITDAICTRETPTKKIKPKILGSPKPTTFQHYLVQPEELVQARNTGNPNLNKKVLKHYASNPKPILRGHKFYWHKHSIITDQIKESDIGRLHKSKSQYTEIQLIESGAEFKFTIRFENLSDIELGALLWVLDLAQDEKYRLSLGMGKPLGMGAVKIEHQLYLNQRQQRYQQLFEKEGSDWLTGYAAEPNSPQPYIDSFDQHICGKIGATEAPLKDVRSLKDVRRIKMLLAMLSWDKAPPAEETRYLEIECDPKKTKCIAEPKKGKDTANEYAERPVLPTPLQVIGWECQSGDNGGGGGDRGGGGGSSLTEPKPEKPRKRSGKRDRPHRSNPSANKSSAGENPNPVLARPPKPPKPKR
ncbi:MAG: TIGR03986 family CRISPR-associated RAMP protein [Spirulinaceae cyanobacterium SM2_1_0]|nr:TIGR03986 family CRISPR-associated RAMP protein [Spirulinaceae cyanobacterium SM2_1_0]